VLTVSFIPVVREGLGRYQPFKEFRYELNNAGGIHYAAPEWANTNPRFGEELHTLLVQLSGIEDLNRVEGLLTLATDSTELGVRRSGAPAPAAQAGATDGDIAVRPRRSAAPVVVQQLVDTEPIVTRRR
jgi:hypothetical protein